MGSVSEELGEKRGLDLEVVALERRAVTEARPAGDEQAPASAQSPLLAPSGGGADDVTVDEEHGRSVPNHLEIELVRPHARTHPTIRPDEADRPDSVPERGGIAAGRAFRAATGGAGLRRGRVARNRRRLDG